MNFDTAEEAMDNYNDRFANKSNYSNIKKGRKVECRECGEMVDIDDVEFTDKDGTYVCVDCDIADERDGGFREIEEENKRDFYENKSNRSNIRKTFSSRDTPHIYGRGALTYTGKMDDEWNKLGIDGQEKLIGKIIDEDVDTYATYGDLSDQLNSMDDEGAANLLRILRSKAKDRWDDEEMTEWEDQRAEEEFYETNGNKSVRGNMRKGIDDDVDVWEDEDDGFWYWKEYNSKRDPHGPFGTEDEAWESAVEHFSEADEIGRNEMDYE